MRGPVPAASSVVDRSGSSARRANRLLAFRLLAILAAHLFDFVTFTIMIQRHDIGAEFNPLVASTYHVNGLVGLFIMKLAVITLVGSVTILLSRRDTPVYVPTRLASFITVLAVIGGAFAGWTNVITL